MGFAEGAVTAAAFAAAGAAEVGAAAGAGTGVAVVAGLTAPEAAGAWAKDETDAAIKVAVIKMILNNLFPSRQKCLLIKRYGFWRR